MPLASGLLTGKFTKNATFEADDHRHFNRQGEGFDRGETLSGVPFETGLAAVEEIKSICPAGVPLWQFAWRWILMFDAVTSTIPGAKRKSRVEPNVAAANIPSLSEAAMQKIREIYGHYLRDIVDHGW